MTAGIGQKDTVLNMRIQDRLNDEAEPAVKEISAAGDGPIDAFLSALSNELGIKVQVRDYVEHALREGSDAAAVTYIECEIGEESESQVIWGVGIDTSTTLSSLNAIISAINRTMR